MSIAHGSPEAQLAEAMAEIFRTSAGGVLYRHLQTEAMTLSAIVSGGLRDQRATDINEGRRFLAVELLGAPNSVREIDGGSNGR